MKKQILLFLLLLLSGCMVGPDYKEPAPDVPEKWANATEENEKKDRNINDEIYWWKNFDDPILIHLVREALKSNYDLKVAFAAICASRAVLLGTEAQLAPEINGIGSFNATEFSLNSSFFNQQQNVNPVTPPGSLSASPATTTTTRFFHNFELGLDTAWEIDIFGRIRRSIEAAEASLEAQVDDAHGVLLSLIAEVATNYINLRSYQKQLEITKKSFEEWDSIYKMNQSLLDAGLVTEIDVYQAKTTRDQTQANTYPLEESIKASMHQLAILIGKPPAALYDLLSETKPIPKMPPQIFAGLPSELLKRRPDIRAAERNLAASTANIGVAVGSLFPIFTFTGTIGYQSSKTSNLLNSKSNFYSFGPGFTWDLIDFGRVRALIEQNIALKDESFFEYKSTILNALADVENSLVNYAEEVKHHTWLKKAVDDSKIAADVSLLRYRSGRIPFIVALQTENTYQQNLITLAQSEATLSLNAVSLYKALGGGWQVDRTDWLRDQ